MCKQDDKQTLMRAAQNTMQKTSLKPITQLIRPMVKKVLPQKSVIYQQLFDIWPDIVNGTEAKNTIPEKITFARQQQKEGVLAIWAQSSAQATEITYNRMMLIQRVNAVFGYALLADIKVTAHPGLGLLAKTKPNPKKVNSAPGISSQSLDKILSGISNPELRHTLSELGSVIPAQPIDNDENKGENNA